MKRRPIAAACALFGWFIGASAGCDPSCEDRDEDLHGLACPAGPDCDDTNPERVANCDSVPAPDCDATPTVPGCPCVPGATNTCYRGPAGTRSVGACRPGRIRCVGDHFGLCVGEVLPEAFETCDGVDEDCDGAIDEHVESPCGDCDSSCVGGVWGGVDHPFEVTSEALALTPDGALTLARVEQDDATLWIPNTGDGTLSRIDARTGLETARYRTAPPGEVPAEPSRVAVDFQGDAWVANRAFEGQASVTEIAGELARCVDRDGSGLIRTSTGPNDVLAFDEDECILRTIEVGEPNAVARALAIDGDRGLDDVSGGNVWVGLYEEGAVLELDGFSGALVQRVELPSFKPYMAAFDGRGVLWLGSQNGVLERVDPRTSPPTVTRIELPDACFETYSLAIAPDDRLYLTGYDCNRVWRYDPARQVFDGIDVWPSARGAAIADGTTLWISHTDGHASAIDLATFSVARTIDLDTDVSGLETTPRETIGTAIDGLGHVWAVSEEGGLHGGGLATRIDPTSSTVLDHLEVGRAPHAQGDLTGWQRLGEVVPEGTTSYVFEGCGDDVTSWVRLHVAGRFGGGSSALVELRHAETTDALSAASFVEIGDVSSEASTFQLTLPQGGVVEVRVTLRARSRRVAPELTRIGVEWDCGGPG